MGRQSGPYTSMKEIKEDDGGEAPPVEVEEEGDPDTMAPLTTWEKLAFAGGSLPNAISVCCMGFFLNPFLLEVALVKASSVSALMLVGRVWDAITTAVAGFLVSKYPTLHNWILFGNLPTCAFYFCLWLVLDISITGRTAYAFTMYLMYQLSSSFYQVPYTALTVRMHTDGKQRDQATTYRMLAEILSVLFGAAGQGVILALYNVNDDCLSCDDTTANTSASTAYFWSAVVMTAVMAIGGVICYFGTSERVPAPKEDKTPKTGSLKDALFAPPFMTLTGAFFFIWLTVQGVQGNILLYSKYSVPTWSDQFQVLLGLLVGCATIGMPIFHVIMKHIGKKPTYAIGAVLLAPSLFGLYWIPEDAPVWLGVILCIISGFGLASAYLLPWSMLPNVVDEAELRTGQRQEAIFYAFFVFFMKIGSGLALAGSALALNLAGWKDAPCCERINPEIPCVCGNREATCNCDVQPDSIGDTLRLLCGIIGPVLVVVGFILILLYPISREDESRLNAELEQRRQEGPPRQSLHQSAWRHSMPTLPQGSQGLHRRSAPILGLFPLDQRKGYGSLGRPNSIGGTGNGDWTG